jgi:hypothetical protein
VGAAAKASDEKGPKTGAKGISDCKPPFAAEDGRGRGQAGRSEPTGAGAGAGLGTTATGDALTEGDVTGGGALGDAGMADGTPRGVAATSPPNGTVAATSAGAVMARGTGRREGSGAAWRVKTLWCRITVPPLSDATRPKAPTAARVSAAETARTVLTRSVCAARARDSAAISCARRGVGGPDVVAALADFFWNHPGLHQEPEDHATKAYGEDGFKDRRGHQKAQHDLRRAPVAETGEDDSSQREGHAHALSEPLRRTGHGPFRETKTGRNHPRHDLTQWAQGGPGQDASHEAVRDEDGGPMEIEADGEDSHDDHTSGDETS